jgi:hypothetical protein
MVIISRYNDEGLGVRIGMLFAPDFCVGVDYLLPYLVGCILRQAGNVDLEFPGIKGHVEAAQHTGLEKEISRAVRKDKIKRINTCLRIWILYNCAAMINITQTQSDCSSLRLERNIII